MNQLPTARHLVPGALDASPRVPAS